MIVPVVLSGGSGTRLWPASRELYPKQLLPLAGEQTMLQNTLSRLDGIEELAPPMVICNESHRFMVAEQLRCIGRSASEIILEPVGRNTAPAAALAALRGLDKGEDPVLLILPADHVIEEAAALKEVIRKGAKIAREGKLITFGVVPSGPETGYGYIKGGEPLPGFPMEDGIFSIDSFKEKPSLERAREYLESGDFFWNSGMFMFRASVFIEELKRQSPEMIEWCRKSLDSAQEDLDFVRLDAEIFARCPADSIDYAVMEKTRAGAVLPLDAGWNDIGAWSALWEIGKKDESDNVLRGDVLTHDTCRCYVNAGDRLVAAIGLKDQVIVETPDAVLVASMTRVQDVKEVVSRLKELGRREASSHRKVYRPWGNYDSIDMSERFQVKKITVNPGDQLSHQMHHHRAEHWIIVKGTARIVKGEEDFLLTENQSTYIPVGTPHRLENPGKIPLELIEVQSGGYLGKDDIVRFDDQCGRV
jgi:mannose-1-phosphate guanylyltransferase/mannose-6-phosphate isomerase